MQITVTITVGTETEGLVLDDSLSNVLFPGLDAMARANAMQDYIENLVVLSHSLQTRQPLDQSQAYVNGHTTETS